MNIKPTHIAGLTAVAVGLAFLPPAASYPTPETNLINEIQDVRKRPVVVPTPIVESIKEAPSISLTEPSIVIPAIGVDDKLNMSNDLDSGPAFWPITGRPGNDDTIAVAGHRTTYTAPFLDLHKLEKGDLIYLSWNGEVHVYEVQGRRILSAKNLHIADARGYEKLLLSACAKADGTPTSLSHRIVIYANPIN